MLPIYCTLLFLETQITRFSLFKPVTHQFILFTASLALLNIKNAN